MSEPAAVGPLRQQSGLRWPAEWERHAATWLSWPHNPETWPGCLDEAEDAFAAMVGALAGRERVCINVADEPMEARVRARLRGAGVEPGAGSGAEVAFFHFPTDDAWVRDHGPIFVSDANGDPVVLDFDFDAWGGKYPPWDRDDAIPGQIASALGLPSLEPGFVLEGGSIDGDGQGTLLTTESCLLDPARRRRGEPPRTREDLERRLARWLGAEQVLWLAGSVAGDDTDGHVDDLARFVAPGRVVAAVETNGADANHAPLAENLRRLREMRCAAGKPLEIATLPMPPAVHHRGERCPASYVNFYLANDVALVPVFGVAEDARALATLGELLTDREIVPIPARSLVVGLGAVHCLTQQQPEAPA